MFLIFNRKSSVVSDSAFQHMYWIDALRGFAALGILFWHYQHFIVGSAIQYPFYNFFNIFYNYGGRAVLLFWIISGFVFAYVYINKPTTGKDFFVNRFARLYPLHFVTLLIVAGLQLISLHQTGEFQIYQINDLYHFFLNLFFISHWGFQDGYSFNGPVWSISIELLIYGVFFISLSAIKKFDLVVASALAVVFLQMYMVGLPGSSIWQCGGFFFAGVVLFMIFKRFKSDRLLLGLIAVCLAVSSWFIHGSVFDNAVTLSLLIGFLALVLTFALLDITSFSRAGKIFKYLGDISYGTYLLHVPIQIIILLIFDRLMLNTDIFLSNTFFVMYFLLVIVCAHMSFLYFENPMRKYIRNKFSN